MGGDGIRGEDNEWTSNAPWNEVLKLIRSMRVHSDNGTPMRFVPERVDCGVFDKVVGDNTHFHNDNDMHNKPGRMTVVIPLIARKTAPFLVSRKPIRRQDADKFRFLYGMEFCPMCSKRIATGMRCIDHPNAKPLPKGPEEVMENFGYCFPTSGLDTEENDVGKVGAVAFGGPQWHARQTNYVTEEDKAQIGTVCECGGPFDKAIPMRFGVYSDGPTTPRKWCGRCHAWKKCIDNKRQCVGVSASFFFKILADYQENETVYARYKNKGTLYEAKIKEFVEDKTYATLEFTDIRLKDTLGKDFVPLQEKCAVESFVGAAQYRIREIFGKPKEEKHAAIKARDVFAELLGRNKQRKLRSVPTGVSAGRRRLINRLATAEASF